MDDEMTMRRSDGTQGAILVRAAPIQQLPFNQVCATHCHAVRKLHERVVRGQRAVPAVAEPFDER
jgi:hypothetical protein